MTFAGRIARHLRPYWLWVLCAGMLVCLASLFGLLTPWPLKVVIDSVLGDQPLPWFMEDLAGEVRRNRILLLWITVGLGFGLSIVQRALDYLNGYVQTKLATRLQLDLREELFQQVQRLSISYRRHYRVGDILTRLGSQSGAISQVGLALLPLIQSGVTLVGMFWVAFLLDPVLALVSLSVVPFLYWSVGYYARHIEPDVREVRNQESGVFSLISEALSLLPMTQIFGREAHECERFRIRGERSLEARLKVTQKQLRFSFLVNLLAAAGVGLVLAVGALHVLSGKLTVGLLLVVVTYIASVYTPLQLISSTVGTLYERLVDLKMVFEMLDAEPDVLNRPSARPVHRIRGDLKFEQVCFSYNDRGPILREISFEVRAGEFVAIVGPTGAGKTTLISLIPRFHDPDMGRVLVDGIDLAEITLRSLRSSISLVTQEPLLSSGSIAENICYGKPGAQPNELREAACAAQIHSFIESLPKGYETIPGEAGIELSAGERQRIALARALIRDAPILILDEPSAHLDARTERSILSVIRGASTGRTTLMVAHRLSTVSFADRILVIDQGRLVEEGSHARLVNQGGLYAELLKTTSALEESAYGRKQEY